MARQSNAKGVSQQKNNRKQKGFVTEVTLRADTTTTVSHNQKSKRLIVTAKDSTGHAYKLRYKKVDENKITITNRDSTKLRINVQAKTPREEEKWYNMLQSVSRFAMMLRTVSVSYKNTYNMYLPGFTPDVGDMLGQQTSTGVLQPGLDFAFGLIGDSYIEKARSNGWLLVNDSVSTPATTSRTEDLQIKASLEPFSDFKIDISLSRTSNQSQSIQYMYEGSPTTRTGSFNMTILSLRSSFGSKGKASNNYKSKVFDKFVSYLPVVQQRVEAQYEGLTYPNGTGHTGTFNADNGTVDQYSADVMIPAFLAAYTGGNAKTSALDLFPTIARMLPNWSVTYKGLSTLPFFRDKFKSVTITHGYKSIYSVGSYSSYSSWIEAFTGSSLGFVESTTTETYVPSSPYNISTVSINESFAPLAGINLTLQNSMTLKLEYKYTRAVTLSMTSAQINETSSKDIVLGWGYKIADFRLSTLWGKKASTQAAKGSKNGKTKKTEEDTKTTSSASKSKTNSKTIAHDLNLSFDFSFRNQDAITRDIQTGLSEATSGNRAIKTSFQAAYTMSRYVTLSLYYDRQRNNPLLSTTSYPTITQDFGLSMKFSLTR